MAFPGPTADNIYSLRISETGSATANFVDNQFEFFHPVRTTEQVWSQGIRIKATTADLEISFDGTNIHGRIAAGDDVIYEDRHESAIAIRGVGATFLLEAW